MSDFEKAVNRLVKVHFTDRVWVQSENGWYSRPATKADLESRQTWVIEHYLGEIDVQTR